MIPDARSTTRTRWSATSAINRPILVGIEREAVRLDHSGGKRRRRRRCTPTNRRRESRDDARGGVDPTNAMVMPIREVDISGLVDGNAIGLIEAGPNGGATISR